MGKEKLNRKLDRNFKKLYNDKPALIRNLILLFTFIFIAIISIRHMVHGGGVAPSIDAVCPFGGFESILTYFSSGDLVPRIMISSLILALGTVIVTIIFSKGFCGQICPFGYMQELIGKIKRKPIKFGKRFEKFDKYAKYLKYAILVAVLIGTYYAGVLVFRSVDPFKTLFHFGKEVIWGVEVDALAENIGGFIALIVVIVGSIYIPRMWCRYFCPLGAGLNLIGRFSFTKLKRETHEGSADKCISCGKCDRVCPMGIKVTEYETVTSLDCINCNKCVNACPKNSLSITTFGKKISPMLFSVLVFLLFFSVIVAAKVVGVWESIPVIEQTDDFNSEEIKGWMSLSDVSEMSGISEEYFFTKLGIEFNTTIPLKDVKNVYPDFEVEVVRLIVDEYDPSSGAIEEYNPDAGKCPFGVYDDSYPGDCGFYKDLNNDYECDYSY